MNPFHRTSETGHISAHNHCRLNRAELERSELCGCWPVVIAPIYNVGETCW